MIPDSIAIKFKGASKKQKLRMAEILIANYTNLINEYVAQADYATTSIGRTSPQPPLIS